jgi:hypothetical protein
MAQNGISTLPTKEARQIAKLDLAAAKRGENYDRDLLPTKYVDNDVVDNPNPGGLQPRRPWTTGSPTPTGNDFAFFGDQNMWLINGGYNAGSTFSSPPPSNPSYTYPDGSYTGKTYNFDGTTWMSSMNLKINNSWTTTAITIDYWFYPTANGVQLLSESDHADVTSGYHYSLIEIDGSGYVHARFYNGAYPTSAIVSSNTVELNKWNHVWFQETATGDHNFTLNNVAVTGNTNYTRIPPSVAEFFLIGLADSTKITATGRFQGKIGYLNIHDYAVASTWDSTNTRFRVATNDWPDPGGLNGGINSKVWVSDAWDQDFAWFDTHSPLIDGVQGSGVGYTVGGTGNHTVRLEGYFYASQAGSYTFTFNHNNLGWAWFGASVATPSVGNATLTSGGSQHTVTLASGDFYPVLFIATTSSPSQLEIGVLLQGPGFPTATNNWSSTNGWH